MDVITLKNMDFFGHTGVLPEEEENGQLFTVTAELFFDEIRGAETDRLEDTTNYAELYALIRELVENDRSDLIEHLAKKICDVILDYAPECVKTAVTVSKPDAPVDGIFETMQVRIERGR